MAHPHGPSNDPDHPTPPDLVPPDSEGREPVPTRDLIPDLEVLRRLGAEREEVYLARDPRLKRLVVVEVLPEELVEDEAARVRFERGAKAVAALDHPNTVTVHRFGYTTAGLPFLVMQHVDGRTLEDCLAAEGPLPMDDARRILHDVAAGLAAAHDHGFVHRDLRPANILCERGTGRAIVTGFGLVGLLPTAEADATRVTRAGEVVGEAGYLSPEQLKGEPVTGATDVYALGIVGYEALTGVGPYRADGTVALGAAHIRAVPRRLKDLRDDVEEDLANLLEHCLAKDPRRRPTAEYIARKLAEGGRAAGTAGGGQGAGKDFVDDLLRRRLPQVVAVTLVVGYAALGFVDQLVDREMVPRIVYPLSLSTYAWGVVASGVISWFHGKKGRQMVSGLEVMVMAVVLVGWLLTCAFIAVA
ncbi:MAG: serine/threonine-protein kinase [Gemmatimonadota bacterium]|jgi:serine/threonine-protein kinase